MLIRLFAAGITVLSNGYAGAHPLFSGSVDPSGGAPIHVDINRGDDDNLGTEAAPWKTLLRLGKARLIKGQRILLHCASTWRETLDLGGHQLADGVTIEPYGVACNGQRPRILGSDNFSGGWTREGALWWRAVPQNIPKIERLFVDGQPMQHARWPNANTTADHAVVDNASAPPQLRQFSVAAQHRKPLENVDLIGSTVQIRSAPWRIDAGTVQNYNQNTGKLTLVNDASYPIPAGTDFVLQGKLWMLDSPGEYLHDLQRNRLYIYPPTLLHQSGINVAKIEGSVRDHGVKLGGRTNLTLRGINVENAQHTGVTIQDAPNALLADIAVRNNREVGVKLITTNMQVEANPTVTVKDSVIEGSSFYGLDAGSTTHARILNNRIEDIGIRADAGNSYAALRLGPASLAEGNHIKSVAYIGIRFNGSGGSKIRNNQIQSFCTRLGDCAAIYTWNGPKHNSNHFDQQALIEGNTIVGDSNRSAHITRNSGWITAGIYLDDYSRGATARRNVVANTPIGIYVHNGSGHTIDSNKVWLTTRAGIWANMDQVDADYMTNNRFVGNELVPVALAQGQWPEPPIVQTSQAIWYWKKMVTYDELVVKGNNNFSNNRVILINESAGQHMRVRGAQFDTYLDSMEWQRLNPNEPVAAIFHRKAIYSMKLGDELLEGGGFENGWGAWGKWMNPQGAGSYANHSRNIGSCTGGCITFVSATSSDLISSPKFNLKVGHPYRISMEMTFPKGGSIGIPYVSRNMPPWDSFVAPGSFARLSRTDAKAGEQIAYESAFKATNSSDARLNIKLASHGLPVHIDNVSLREITAYSVIPIKDLAAVLFSEATGTRIMTCTDLGWPEGCSVRDIDGKVVTLPISFQPDRPMLLVRGD